MDKGELLHINSRMDRFFLGVSIFLIMVTIISTIMLVWAPLLIMFYGSFCLIFMYLICIVSLTFIENPLKIYTTGIDIPRSLFKRIFFQKQVFYPYFEILSIYPSYYQVDTGPGARGGEYSSSPGVTTLLGINIEFQDGRTHLIKFPAYYSTDPKNADKEFEKTFTAIKTLFKEKGWKLIRNPPNLTSQEIIEYEQIGKKHFSQLYIREILITFVILLLFLPFNLYLVKISNIQPQEPAIIIAIFVSITPMLIIALYVHKKERSDFKKINLYMKYRTHRSEMKKG